LRHTILNGDVIACLRSLPDACVQCVVTSPPYWGLRDYGVEGQIGLEPTPEEYAQKEGLARKARSFRSTGTHMNWKSFWNFVPFMPLTGTKARKAYSFVTFHMRERSKKVMKTRAIPALRAPTFREVI